MQFHPTIKFARDAIDSLKKIVSDPLNKEDEGLINTMKEKLQACRLGLTVAEMSAAPGFSTWARSVFLYLRLARYRERLMFDGEQRLCIKYNDKYTPWVDIPDDIKAARTLPSFDQCPFMVAHHYLLHGVVAACNVYEWPDNKLRQLFQETPEELQARGGGYAISIRTSTNEGGPRFSQGDHSWINLHSADGKVYAVGLYRPNKSSQEKTTWGVLASGHLKVKLGTLIDDWSEFYDDNITNLTVAINETQFQAVVQKLEADHLTGAPFQMADYNCSMYALSLLRLCGVDMARPFHGGDDFVDSAQVAAARLISWDTVQHCPAFRVPAEQVVMSDVEFTPFMHFNELLIKTHKYHRCRRLYNKLPRAVRLGPRIVSRVAWNVVHLGLGGSAVHPELAHRGIHVRAPMPSLGHALLDWKRPSVCLSPFHIGQLVTPAVMRARAAQGLGRLLIPKAWVIPHTDSQKPWESSGWVQ